MYHNLLYAYHTNGFTYRASHSSHVKMGGGGGWGYSQHQCWYHLEFQMKHQTLLRIGRPYLQAWKLKTTPTIIWNSAHIGVHAMHAIGTAPCSPLLSAEVVFLATRKQPWAYIFGQMHYTCKNFVYIHSYQDQGELVHLVNTFNSL